MKKFFETIAIILLALAVITIPVSLFGSNKSTSGKSSVVEKETLSAPVITISENTIAWETVENATSYVILSDGYEIATTTDTS